MADEVMLIESSKLVEKMSVMADYTSPNWTRVALLTIDVQKDFTLPSAAAEIPGTFEAVPKIQ